MSLSISPSYSPTQHDAGDSQHTANMYSQSKGFCPNHPSVRIKMVSGGLYRKIDWVPCSMCRDEHVLKVQKKELALEKTKAEIKKAQSSDTELVKKLQSELREKENALKELEEVREQYLENEKRLFMAEKKVFEQEEKAANDALRISSLRTLLHGHQEQCEVMGDSHYLIKILLLGSSGVGKTSIFRKYCDENSDIRNQLSTIGIDFQIKSLNNFVGSGRNVKLQLWDTAGQERFNTITPSYYKGVHGAIVVFDISDKESYDCVPEYLDCVRRYATLSSFKTILVGNKSDKEKDRVVPKESAKSFAASQNDMKYLETSALNNTDVQRAVEVLTLEILAEFQSKLEKKMSSVKLPTSSTLVNNSMENKQKWWRCWQ